MGLEKKVVSTRLDEELIELLNKIAKKENRTVSNLIETILKQYATSISDSREYTEKSRREN